MVDLEYLWYQYYGMSKVCQKGLTVTREEIQLATLHVPGIVTNRQMFLS